ncbi:MAG: DUF5678 domain-containing protein, partial [Thermoproteota archaeon]|nr:DUF5678 domain-containing protein [Thermoproteota archaeon]
DKCIYYNLVEQHQALDGRRLRSRRGLKGRMRGKIFYQKLLITEYVYLLMRIKQMSLLEMPNTISKANANFKWFVDNHEMLIDKFKDKFVAIDNDVVIESNSDIHDLLKRLQENKNHSNSTLIQFISNENNNSHSIKYDY